MAFLIGGANSAADTAYSVANSVRLDGSSAYMYKTFGTPTDAKIWTYSFWVKKSGFDGDQAVLGCGADGNNRGLIYLADNGKLAYYETTSGSDTTEMVTNRLFRDVSAWYHIVVAVDTSQGTEANRVKIYVNGTQETSFSTANYPDENATDKINSAIRHDISGRNHASSSDLYLNGHLSEVVFIDGQQLAPTSFGEFDEDSPTIWKPKDVSGLTFGTNGFYLDFEDSANLGNDANGGTDFTESNLAATDQATDTPTNNFATLNPLHFNATIPSAGTLSDGNLTFTSAQGSSAYPAFYSTIAATAGKWYAEFKATTASDSMIGIGDGIPSGGYLGGSPYDYLLFSNGNLYNNGSGTSTGYNSVSDDDIIGVAFDLDNNKMYVAINNTWQASGDPAGNSGGQAITAASSTTSGVYHFGAGDAGGGTPAIQSHFGGTNTYSISSGNADANGYGNFEYAPPSGFYALCTKNLAEFGG